VAEDLLRAEGFTEISFVEVPDTLDQEMIARGNADFSLDFALKYITAIDAGEPLTRALWRSHRLLRSVRQRRD
jgi:hypothetical protein